MNSNELLDAVKERLQLQSDYALAKKLDITQESIRQWRHRGLSDERAVQICELLKIDPNPVLADIHAERATNPKTRKTWQAIAERLRGGKAAALAAFTIVSLANILPPYPQVKADERFSAPMAAQGQFDITTYTLCAMRRMAARFSAFLRSLFIPPILIAA